MNSPKKILLCIFPALLVGLIAGHMTDFQKDRVSMINQATLGSPPQQSARGISNLETQGIEINQSSQTSSADTFEVAAGRVRAHLQNISLPAVLAAIARNADVKLSGSEYLPDTASRVDLDDIPVAEAFLRLSSGYDCAFKYQGARLIQFAIQPTSGGSADNLQQADVETIANFDKLQAPERGDAIEQIALRDGPGAREAVAHALTDSDEAVRLRALEQSQVVQGLALQIEDLQTLVQQDASENVRLKALDVLATDPRVDVASLVAIAQTAESDPSELVRAQAAALRERLETSTLSQFH